MTDQNGRDERAATTAPPDAGSPEVRRVATRVGWLATAGAVALLVLAACDQQIAAPVGAPSAAQVPGGQPSLLDRGRSDDWEHGRRSPSVERELAALRRATARFHDGRSNSGMQTPCSPQRRREAHDLKDSPQRRTTAGMQEIRAMQGAIAKERKVVYLLL